MQVDEVKAFVQKIEDSMDDDAFDIVVKPTHLSNGSGALIFSKKKWAKKEYSAEKLVKHMEKYLVEKPLDCESEALKSLIPGFIVQPRYRSCVDMGTPLELRVITLWGKARLGIWWWGRQSPGSGRDDKQKPQRTTWLVRRPKIPGKLGSGKHSIRLNEVAYGSGVDYRQRSPNRRSLVDDSPAIAQILQEGLNLCQQRHPPEHFLAKLGVEGMTYEALEVSEVPDGSRPRLPTAAISGFEEILAAGSPSPVADSECVTRKSLNTSFGNSGWQHVKGPPVVLQVWQPAVGPPGPIQRRAANTPLVSLIHSAAPVPRQMVPVASTPWLHQPPAVFVRAA